VPAPRAPPSRGDALPPRHTQGKKHLQGDHAGRGLGPRVDCTENIEEDGVGSEVSEPAEGAGGLYPVGGGGGLLHEAPFGLYALPSAGAADPAGLTPTPGLLAPPRQCLAFILSSRWCAPVLATLHARLPPVRSPQSSLATLARSPCMNSSARTRPDVHRQEA